MLSQPYTLLDFSDQPNKYWTNAMNKLPCFVLRPKNRDWHTQLDIFSTHHAEGRCYPKKKVPKKTLQIQKI